MPILETNLNEWIAQCQDSIKCIDQYDVNGAYDIVKNSILPQITVMGQQAAEMDITSAQYTSKDAGVASPVNSAMYLATGNYNFYGAANNNENGAVPTFTNGTASSLSKGIDYLGWIYSDGIDISSSHQFTVNFKHLCTQVLLVIDTTVTVTSTTGTTTTSSAVKITDFSSATVTPSTTSGATWSLSTAAINPVSTVGTAVSMGMTDNYAQYIMLPLASSTTDLTFNFTVMLEGETVARNYQAVFPLPSGALVAGQSYKFQVQMLNNEVTYTSVNVINWVEVSGGAPVIPTQITGS